MHYSYTFYKYYTLEEFCNICNHSITKILLTLIPTTKHISSIITQKPTKTETKTEYASNPNHTTSNKPNSSNLNLTLTRKTKALTIEIIKHKHLAKPRWNNYLKSSKTYLQTSVGRDKRDFERSPEAGCEERGDRLRVRVISVERRGVEGDWFGCLSESV